MALVEGPNGVVGAWDTDGQIYFGQIKPGTEEALQLRRAHPTWGGLGARAVAPTLSCRPHPGRTHAAAMVPAAAGRRWPVVKATVEVSSSHGSLRHRFL